MAEIPPDTQYETASVSTTRPMGAYLATGQLKNNITFTWQDISVLAQALNKQGNWFMGQDVRTPETAWKVARDLLVILEMMGFQTKVKPGLAFESVVHVRNLEGPQEFEADRASLGTEWQKTHGGVTGQAGNSR